jgi:nicotinamidase-related amidase
MTQPEKPRDSVHLPDSADPSPTVDSNAGPSPVGDRATRDRSILMVIDMQARLLPAISGAERLTANVDRLIRGAHALHVPVLATEHCADAIGPTDLELARHLSPGRIVAKRHFNAMDEAAVVDAVEALPVEATGLPYVVICGVEAHVCVAQTALGLRARGHAVFVVEDACGSRHGSDREVGLARLRQAGCVPMSVEAVLFEWLAHAGHPGFKDVLSIIKEV